MITDNDMKKLEKRFTTKEDLVDFKDAILHEIRDLRDDITVTTGYRDRIEDLDNRLEVVEIKLAISPAQ